MCNIPLKVQAVIEQNNNYEWLEENDRLEMKSDYSILYDENQLKFWLINCSIREAFKEIEKKCSQKIANQQKVSPRDVSISAIARKASCDRNTLKHPLREKWVNNRREKLLSLLNEPETDFSLKVARTPEEELKLELERMKKELFKSKKEIGKWYMKYQDVISELKMQENVISRQAKITSLKDNEISSLKKRIKDILVQD